MYLVLVLTILIISFVKYLTNQTPRPILSVYRQPDKWYYVKFGICYIFLKLKKEISKLNSTYSAAKSKDGKTKYQSIIGNLENSSNLNCYPKSADSAYFNACNSNGYHLIAGITVRPFGIGSGFLLLKIPGIGFLESIKLPDSMMFENEAEKSIKQNGSWTNRIWSEGLNIISISQFKKWKLNFFGKMKDKDDPRKVYDVAINTLWTSNLEHFDLDWDYDPMSLARSFAREPWNKDFFKTIQIMHQVHHEQYGTLKGSILINGETHKIKLSSQRIHIFGTKQLWKKIHRYVMHTMILQDGTRITVAIASIPVTLSNKYYGYVYNSKGEMMTIDYCSLCLHELGEGGCPPADYSFTITAGGDSYLIEIEVLESTEFYIGWQWEIKVVECLAKYKVNGAAGSGAVEWYYRHTGGRPKQISLSDPLWAKRIKA